MNKHIFELCEAYAVSEKNPEYAILLKGEWGCGKTWFIKEFIKAMVNEKNIEEKEIMYISAFGVNSMDDLFLRFFESLYPMRSNQICKYLGRVIKKSVENKIGIEIDFGEDKININDLKKKLIIIDDIERSDIAPTHLLGGLLGLIIDDNIRIILIANEDEYKRKFEVEKQKYEKIREKVIGYTLEVAPDYDNSIDLFIDEFELKEKIDGLKELVVDIMRKLNINNLRTVRQAFQSFIYILNNIKDIEDKEYIKELIEAYLVLFFQYSSGDLKRENIREAVLAYYKYGESVKKYISNKKDSSNNEAFYEDMYFNKLPMSSIIEDIIFDFKFDKSSINQAVKSDIEKKEYAKKIKEGKLNEKIPTLYFLIQNWRDIPSGNFESTIEKLINELHEGKYNNVGQLLNFVDLMFNLSKEGIIPYDKNSIMNMIKSCIEKNEILPLDKFPDEHFNHWGFSNIKTKEFIMIKEILEEHNKTKLLESAKIEVEGYINNLDENCKKLSNCLCIEGDGHKYLKIPIIKEVDITNLFNNFKNLDTHKKMIIIDMFNSRYEMKYGNGSLEKELYSEYDSICKFRDLYKEEIENINSLYNPQIIVEKEIYNNLCTLTEYMKARIYKNSK